MTNKQRGPGSDEWRGMTPQDRGLTTPMVDDVFDALSDWRRRAVCRYLATCDAGGVEVSTLATAISKRAQASDVPEAEASAAAIERTLTETHLPVLHRLGIVDFDERSQSVRYWESPTVEKWAEHAQSVTDRTEF
ncbi:DUF7344 domain-containing protein [Haloarcula marina]|uniref:DUF7344 domain-containing protein n=1 Tax=Haloarcula marina TaxID=2961574 RepID=UPI0020B74B6C|nr:ArsR family transcriptional regulator [Halomicroarcula marina]